MNNYKKNYKSSHKPLNRKQKFSSYEGNSEFLPMCYQDMQARSWKELDILLISGDAYIDHPAFATALLGRLLQYHGFRVGVITQPDWKDPNITEKLQAMGRPRLFAGISAGAIDSMLAHYTAFRKKRHDDAYTPGGKWGARPNRAITVYTNLVKQAFPDLPIVGGGIESSLRRLSHYDFWTDSLRKSIIADAKLDLLIYGMGERAIVEVAENLDDFYQKHPECLYTNYPKQKKSWQEALQNIDGTVRIIKKSEIVNLPKNTEILPSHQDIEKSPKLLLESSLMSEKHIQHADHLLVQIQDAERAVLVEKPAKPLTSYEMDLLYDLPFSRKSHPIYKHGYNPEHRGEIPAESMMQSSITSHRGCGGGCSFCSLALHQGREISSRSKKSIFAEINKLAKEKSFNGSISDVGGPSANMWQAKCKLKQKENTFNCKRSSCLTPKICPNFDVDQDKHIELLEEIKNLPKIKNVRIASGVRFDLALTQKNALAEYAGQFTGGQLKVAPEHCSANVLNLMRKPQMDSFEIFLKAFYNYCKKVGKEQYVVPYLLSAFPGCTDENMQELAKWLQDRNWKPQQVQCFVPTPGTVATAMFFAECDMGGNKIFVAKSDAQRLRQHGILMGTTVDL